MDVTVKLHGSLRRWRPGGRAAEREPFVISLEGGATVRGALQTIEIPDELISAVAVNGAQAEPGTVLRDGDVVHVFPPAAGG